MTIVTQSLFTMRSIQEALSMSLCSSRCWSRQGTMDTVRLVSSLIEDTSARSGNKTLIRFLPAVIETKLQFLRSMRTSIPINHNAEDIVIFGSRIVISCYCKIPPVVYVISDCKQLRHQPIPFFDRDRIRIFNIPFYEVHPIF